MVPCLHLGLGAWRSLHSSEAGRNGSLRPGRLAESRFCCPRGLGDTVLTDLALSSAADGSGGVPASLSCRTVPSGPLVVAAYALGNVARALEGGGDPGELLPDFPHSVWRATYGGRRGMAPAHDGSHQSNCGLEIGIRKIRLSHWRACFTVFPAAQ
jgi:hypothetical protein